MEITATFDDGTRAAWRAWLTANGERAREVWVLLRRKADRAPGYITYLDAVEEALCFGWIDGTAKRHGDFTAQRFTPRRAKSNWTELNKERARRLIRDGRMTDAGRRTLPDLADESLHLPADIEARLREAPGAWENFERFPSLYQRIRVSNIEEVRKRDPNDWERRLATFVAKTAAGEMFGNWDDATMARSEE